MDIHTATLRRARQPVPIVVVFHGGGLIGGSRDNTTTFADYFASIGFVGVNAGYRLAPDSRWPEGARDVGAVVTWLRDHATESGGDPPSRICKTTRFQKSCCRRGLHAPVLLSSDSSDTVRAGMIGRVRPWTRPAPDRRRDASPGRTMLSAA
jgi:hypothetical protein